jgi:hypothetical protein
MFRRYGSAILRAPEGDNVNGGGNGGGDGKGEPQKAPFSEDQFVAIGEIVNKALTSKIPKMVSGGFAEAMKSTNWEELLSPVITKLAPKPASGSGGGDGDEGSKSKGTSKVDPEIARQLTKLTEDFENERKARLAAVQESENIKREHEFGSARQKLYEGLKPHASESLHDVWVDHLIHHKRLKVEGGQQLLEVEYAPVKGMPKQKEFLPLEEALPHLVAADEAKRFLPVPDAGDGGGSRAPRGGRRGSGAPSIDSKNPAERVAARLAALGIDFDSEFS